MHTLKKLLVIDWGGGSRGFGYWSWKPQIIMQSLNQIENDDILIYADTGCEFIPYARNNLLSKLAILQEHDIVGFKMNGLLERQWSKADIFEHFGVLHNPAFTDTPQIKATSIFMKKSYKTMQIIQEWLDIFYNHFHLVDDSPSKIQNYDDFIENRHDQSIFSMLLKKYNCFVFDDYYSSDGKNVEFGILDSRNKVFIDNPRVINHIKILSKIYPSHNTRKVLNGVYLLCCNTRS